MVSSTDAGEGIVAAATTADVLAALPSGGLLTEPEQERAAALRSSRQRDDFVAAHLLARACAAALLSLPIDRLTFRQRCPECRGSHGPPFISAPTPLALSLAHASGHVAAAASPFPVGADVEPVRAILVDDHLARIVMTEREVLALQETPNREVAFLRQWVRREALIKVGALTLDTVRSVDLSHLPPGEPDGGWATHRLGDLILADWRVDAAVGAVASRGHVTLWSLADVLGMCGPGS